MIANLIEYISGAIRLAVAKLSFATEGHPWALLLPLGLVFVVVYFVRRDR